MSFYLIIFLLGSCTLYEPSLPKWDTSWKIYLQQDAVKISDILASDPAITDSLDNKTGEQTYYLSIKDTSKTQVITDKDLKTKADNQHFSNILGVFNIDPPATESVQGSSFGEIFSNLNPRAGEPLPPIDPIVIAPDPDEFAFENFREIDIVNATLHLVFYNNLIFGIDEQMSITIYDKMRLNDPDGGVVDSIVFNEKIPAHSFSESNEIDLSGKKISNELQLRYRFRNG